MAGWEESGESVAGVIALASASRSSRLVTVVPGAGLSREKRNLRSEAMVDGVKGSTGAPSLVPGSLKMPSPRT